jgi:Arc/MetJ-type ribon-helix-helix transcriptional regulator
MKLISVYLPRGYLEKLDMLVARGFYPSRAEAIRLAVRDLILNELESAVETFFSKPSLSLTGFGFHGAQKP